jgi:hypothetical protein
MLFHVSEASGIARFEPRASGYTSRPVVWAIDASRLCNYLVPRDCPRVTYYAGGETTPADVERFLGSSPAVVAVESRWLERLRSCRLYSYHLPPETFECLVEIFDDPIAELLRRGVELRLVPCLWPLRDAVVASTLRFSFIRMRPAVPMKRASPVVGPKRATSGLTWIPVGTARPINSSVRPQEQHA